MLPPIPIPNVAERLTGMAQQATLAPIQQAAGVRGQVFTPPAPRPQPGLAEGLGAFAQGAAQAAGIVKADQETDALAQFVRGALGETLPEGAKPVEGLPWRDQQGSLPPVPPRDGTPTPEGVPGATPAAMPGGQTPGAGVPMPTPSTLSPASGAQTTPDKEKINSAATRNPLGFTDRQTAILRGMLDSGNSAQIRKAADLVMMKTFEAPPEAQSTIGKLIADMKNAPEEMRLFYQNAIAKETAVTEKDTRTSSLKEYEAAKADGFTGSFMDYQTALKQAGASRVSVNTGDNAYAKERGKQLATARQELAERAQVARGTRSRVQQATKLLGEIETGALTPTLQGAKRIGKALGIDLAKYGITDDVSAAENFQAITGQFLMDYIQQTKGAISEKENELFQSFSPGLAKTKEGNRMLLQWADAVAKREIDLNRLATQYERENGQLDAGWEDAKAQWQDAHPIIDIEKTEAILGSAGADTISPSTPGTSAALPPMGVQPPAPPPAAAPAAGTIENGYRFKGGNPADPNSWEKL